MTTAIANWKRDFLKIAGKELSVFSFSPRPKGQSFYRTTPTGRVAVHFSFIDHEGDFDATIDVAVRFNEVEDIVNLDNQLLTKKEKADTFTVGAELGTIRDGKPYRVTVAAHDLIQPAVSSLISLFREVGEQYLEKYSTLENAYSDLARDDDDSCLVSPFPATRAKLACAALVVLGRVDELRTVAEEKLAYLKKIGNPSAASFKKFADQLSVQHKVDPI